MSGNSSAINIQKLFAGMMLVMVLTDSITLTCMTYTASQLQYAAMQMKEGTPTAATAAAAAEGGTNECEDESLLYLLDCLMMLYSAAVHRVLREVCMLYDCTLQEA